MAVVMVVILSALTVLTRHTPREKKMSAGPMLGAVAAAANPEMQLAWEGEAETTLFTVCIVRATAEMTVVLSVETAGRVRMTWLWGWQSRTLWSGGISTW